MEVIIILILIWSAISWHIQNKPKRYKPSQPSTPKERTKRTVFRDIKISDIPYQPTFGDPYMSASDKLAHMNSPYWRQLKLDRLALSNNQCELCNSTQNLHLHHTSYIRLGCEKLSDVTILCNSCHQLQHDHYGYNRETEYYPLIKPKPAE